MSKSDSCNFLPHAIFSVVRISFLSIRKVHALSRMVSLIVKTRPRQGRHLLRSTFLIQAIRDTDYDHLVKITEAIKSILKS